MSAPLVKLQGTSKGSDPIMPATATKQEEQARARREQQGGVQPLRRLVHRRDRKAARVMDALAPPVSFDTTLDRVWTLVDHDVTLSIMDSGIGIPPAQGYRCLQVHGVLEALAENPLDTPAEAFLVGGAVLSMSPMAHHRSYWSPDDDNPSTPHLTVLMARLAVILTRRPPARPADELHDANRRVGPATTVRTPGRRN